MLDILPKINKNYNFDISEITSCVLEKDYISKKDVLILVVPIKRDGNDITIKKENVFIYRPIFKDLKTLYSDESNGADLFFISLMTRSSLKKGYDGFILISGSIEDSFTIDGCIEDITALKDKGLNIINAYITNKRDEYYNSEKIFDKQVEARLNEKSFKQTFPPMISLSELKSFIAHLKLLAKKTLIVRYEPEQVSVIIREMFYEKVKVDKYELITGADLFLITAELLSSLKIIEIIAVNQEKNIRFNFFEEEELRDSISPDGFNLLIKFNKRFINLFKNNI